MVAAPFEGIIGFTPPAPSVVDHAGRSGGHDRSPTSLGSMRVHNPQRGDARQLRQRVRYELAVAAIRGLIRNRPSQLLPRSIRGGTGHDP